MPDGGWILASDTNDDENATSDHSSDGDGDDGKGVAPPQEKDDGNLLLCHLALCLQHSTCDVIEASIACARIEFATSLEPLLPEIVAASSHGSSRRRGSRRCAASARKWSFTAWLEEIFGKGDERGDGTTTADESAAVMWARWVDPALQRGLREGRGELAVPQRFYIDAASIFETRGLIWARAMSPLRPGETLWLLVAAILSIPRNGKGEDHLKFRQVGILTVQCQAVERFVRRFCAEDGHLR